MNAATLHKIVLPVLFMLAATQCQAGEIFVISNPSVSLSVAEVKDVFLGEQQFSGNITLVIVNNTDLVNEFSSRVLNLDAAAYNLYWVKKSFRDGIRLPVMRANNDEVLSFVRKTTGAIGYVSTAPTGVKVIKRY